METIIQTISLKERAALRTMEMSAYFQWKNFSGVLDISSWGGGDYEFMDAAMQKQWAPLMEAIGNFRTELAMRSLPKSDDLDWYSIRADAKREIWEADAIFLNKATDELSHQLDSFIKFGRRRLTI